MTNMRDTLMVQTTMPAPAKTSVGALNVVLRDERFIRRSDPVPSHRNNPSRRHRYEADRS
jgi:hypothetical protein